MTNYGSSFMKSHTLLCGLGVLLPAITLSMTTAVDAATIDFINVVNYNQVGGGKLHVAGVSDDGLTVVGTIRVGPGSGGDRGFYWRKQPGGAEPLALLNGFDSETYVTGISADGLTAVGQAKEPLEDGTFSPRLMYVTNLGQPNQSTQYVLPAGYKSTSSGPTPYNASRGMPISADGLTIAGQSVTTGNASSQVHWSPSDAALHSIPGTTGGSGKYPTAVSGDGSVIVGNAVRFGQAYRWTSTGGTTLLSKPNGDIVSGPAAISDDGNTVAVEDGLWTVSGGFQSLPGYTSLGFMDEAVVTQSSDMSTLALSADGTWAAGISDAGNARTGWVWNQAYGTVEITSFLADHGIETSMLLPSTGDPLSKITGLALNGNTLTLVGNTYNENGWIATVELTSVPEPTSLGLIVGAGAFLLSRSRQRRSS